MKYYGIAQFSVLPEYDAGARGLYHFLAWGNHLDERWYRDMNQPDQIPNVAEYVNNHLDDVTQACDDNILEPEDIENVNMSVEEDAMEQSEESEEEIESDDDCQQKLESFKSVINNEFCNFWQPTGMTNLFRNVSILYPRKFQNLFKVEWKPSRDIVMDLD